MTSRDHAKTTQIDGLHHLLSSLLDQMASNGMQDAIWDSTVERVCSTASVRAGIPPSGTTLDGAAAYEALLAYHEDALRWATRLAQRFSPAEWLFFLRRSSGLFDANHHPSTAGYCQILAEAVSLRSKALPPNLHLGDPTHAYPIDREVALAIVSFAEAVVLIYELQSKLRWSGKGASVVFTPGARPEVAPSSELEAAVKLYDRRSSGNLLAGLGVLSNDTPQQPTEGDTTFLPLWFSLSEPLPLPLHDGSDALVEAWFILQTLQLSRAPHLALGSARLDQADIALIAVLVGVFFEKFLRGPELGQAYRVGYMHLKPPALRGWLAYGLDVVRAGPFGTLIDPAEIPDDATQAVGILHALEPTFFPPKPGTPLRRTTFGYTLDLMGATWSLVTRFRRLAVIGGPVANARAQTFEEQVQDMIDETRARPRDAWRDYRGRTLRIEGEPVTDIDALFELDGRLVLVNCKSVPDSDELERGDWKAIRNTVSRIHSDIAAWEQKVARLRQQCTGDNYDFTSAASIDPLVVYPKALFVPLGPATRETLDGLPISVGAGELRRWIEAATVGLSDPPVRRGSNELRADGWPLEGSDRIAENARSACPDESPAPKRSRDSEPPARRAKTDKSHP